MLVIGSRNSSNSNRLVEVAREHGADSHLIDNESEVREEWLAGKRVVGITSGASAPEELVQRLVEFFGARGTTDVQELEVVQEDVRFMLPKVIRQADRGRLLGVDRCARSSSRICTSARTAGPTSCAATASALRWWRVCGEFDRLVLLGDMLELRHGPVAVRVGRRRTRCCAELGAAVGEVVVIPGNHDHALLRGWLERRDPDSPLGLESAVDWDRREPLGSLVEALAPARVRVAYPGVWLRDDVYAIHGHYGDRHTTVPMFERLGAGAAPCASPVNPPAGRRAPRTTRPRSRRCTRGPTRSPRAAGCTSGAAGASRSRRGSA